MAANKKEVVVILPIVMESESQDGDVLMSSPSPDEYAGNNSNYPIDLLGVSWGSYLQSTPPSRSDGFEAIDEERVTDAGGNSKEGLTDRSTDLSNLRKVEEGSREPHPLLEQLSELMKEIVKYKEELAMYGMDASSLRSVSDLSLESQYSALQATMSSAGNSSQEALLDSQLLEGVIRYTREVLAHLVQQGKTTAKQSHFLQRTARKLNENHQKTLIEQKSIQQIIRDDKVKLEAERQELEKDKAALLNAQVEFKRMLHDVDIKLREREIMTRKMDSPHTVAQGQSQIIALSKTQKQQSYLEKMFSKQLRDLKSLQQAHDQTRSELLAAKEQATRLQHKLSRQVHEIRSSEASIAGKFEPGRVIQSKNMLALEGNKRKTYKGVSQAQISATLRNITTAHKNLCRDIEKMQRKLSQQQTAGVRVSRQMDQSQRELVRTNSQLKQQSLSIRKGQPLAEKEEFKLPRLNQPKANPTKRRSHKESLSLPKIEHSRRAEPIIRTNPLPIVKQQYQFSKEELHTLASFNSHKSAKEVTDWLQTQGNL